MHNRLKAMTAAALSLCLLTGCGGEESATVTTDQVVGTWVQTMSDCTETMKLNSDMTYDKEIKYTSGAAMTSQSHATWSLNGNKISISYSDFNTTSEYTVKIDGSTMTWDSGDAQIVYTKKN